MWTLPKPLLEEALNDIVRTIAEDRANLDDNDSIILSQLYRLYDHNGGYITNADENRLNLSKRNAIHKLYDKTQQGRRLSYIRTQLMQDVDYCPMCGISPPSQLDHQMPKDDYKSLSVCRLNLVPTCGVCNNKKRNCDPSDFVHPYYSQAIIGVPFFEIEIHSSPITHRISWKFSINKAIVPDQDLADRIVSQIGVIKLFHRLYKETNLLLSDILNFDVKSQTQLDIILDYEYKKYANNNRYGINDWRCVFLKSLIESPHFTIEEARVYASHIRPINGGVNA